jgi:hypothetical protein
MNTTHRDTQLNTTHPARQSHEAKVKRVLKASILALAICGGGYAWQHNATERVEKRAEQARIDALRLTPHKTATLQLEAERDAAAKAFAERQAAERAQRELEQTAENMTATAQAKAN